MDLVPGKSAIQSAETTGWLEVVRQQVASLRYGVVEIVVHDSRVVQLEKTERVRFEKQENRELR